MRSMSINGRHVRWMLSGSLWLGLAAGLEAQDVRQPGTVRLTSHCAAGPVDCYVPPPSPGYAYPGLPVMPGERPLPPGEPGVSPPAPGEAPPAPLPPADTMADTFPDAMAAFDPGQAVAGLGASFAAANAIGDFIGAPFTFDLIEAGADGVFGTGDDVKTKIASPFSTRTFKIFEGQNARPQDRVFAKFNRFNDVGNVQDNILYRYVVGLEKTALDGRASFGLQMPFFTVDPATLTLADGSGGVRAETGQFGTATGTQSDIGDLTVFLKYALYYDPYSIDTFSVGVAYAAPTGPDTIAGVDSFIDVRFKNRGSVQPFTGFLSSLHGNWFAYGFSAVDIPIDSDDTTFLFNDLGIGYYLANPCADLITAIVPKLEVHVISPIHNRRQPFSIREDPNATSPLTNFSTRADQDSNSGVLEIHNQVNITAGITFEIRRNVTFTFAYVAPLAGPNPFDHELQFQLQIFGGDPRTPFGVF